MKSQKIEFHININFFQDELTKPKKQKTIKRLKGAEYLRFQWTV